MDMTVLDRAIEAAATRSLAAVMARWLIFATVTAVTFAAFTAVILSLTPVYESSAVLLTAPAPTERASEAGRTPAGSSSIFVQLARSNEVLQAAIIDVGSAYQPPVRDHLSLISQLRIKLWGEKTATPPAPEPMAAAIADVRSHLSVASELNSNIATIGFRDTDPVLAAKFANSISVAAIDRQIALSANPLAASFFSKEKAHFDAEFADALAALQAFAVKNHVYAIDEQRQLLLKRNSDLEARMAEMRGEIAEKQSQRQTLAGSLRTLAPVARSPYASSLVDSLGGDRPGNRRANTAQDDQNIDPSLLLTQVYQQSMVSLFKLNADIAGAQNFASQLDRENSDLRREIDALSMNAETVERLQQRVRESSYSAETYAKRAVEERIASELQTSRVSAARLLQTATEPFLPTFPNYKFMLLAAALFSLMLGVGTVLLLNRNP